MGVGQHQQIGGRAVHGVGALPAHDGGVHPGKLGPGGRILDHHDLGALQAHGGGGVGAGLQHGGQFGLGDLVGLVGAAAAAGL